MKTIEVSRLTRRFGNLIAVDRMTFSVGEGEVFGVLGPNGAGKTTLVRLLNGVLAPSDGEIRVLGMDPTKEGSGIRARTGVLTETPSLYEHLTAWENLQIFGELYDVPRERLPGRIDELLALFGLEKRGKDLAGGFSKGMKQRLALARALVHDPPILFLDEPTSGLDPEAAHQVTGIIEDLSREGKTIFLCTHNLSDAQRLCDRVALFNRGRLLALGTVQELSSKLWGEKWVDIELLEPPTEGMLRIASESEGSRGARIEKSRLRVQLEQPEALARLIKALVEEEARIIRVQSHEPSLETIYFALQEKEGQ